MKQLVSAGPDSVGSTPEVPTSCPFCGSDGVQSMSEGALLGIKRAKGSELYPCHITRCPQCGHIALFDSNFLQGLAVAQSMSEPDDRPSDGDGGESVQGPSGTSIT